MKAQDTYKTKLQLAQESIQELQAWGFKFELVLADSLYGGHPFISGLNQFEASGESAEPLQFLHVEEESA